MNAAYEELERSAEGRVGSSVNWTGKQTFEWVCERAGITVARGLELQALQKKSPEKLPEWAKEA